MRPARFRRLVSVLVLVLAAGLAMPAFASMPDVGHPGVLAPGAHVRADGTAHVHAKPPAPDAAQRSHPDSAKAAKVSLHCPGCLSAAECAIACLDVVVIVAGTWSLLHDSVRLALAAVPPGIDQSAVAAYLRRLPGVQSVHDLHIWGMSTTETALTAHLVRPGSLDDALLRHAAEGLRERFSVGLPTFQFEAGDPAHSYPLASE